MNDEIDLELWYQAYSQDIYHFLTYYNRTHDVDDLLQEVFLKAYRKRAEFKGDASPKTWLITIARHVSIDYARKRKLNQIVPFKEMNDMTSENPEELVLMDERDASLYDGIYQLKRNYRDVIMCKGIAELTSLETAEVLDWSREKVDTTYHRAKRQLKKIIDRQGRDMVEKRRFRSSNK